MSGKQVLTKYLSIWSHAANLYVDNEKDKALVLDIIISCNLL